jgi:hypothetical protein
MAELDITFVCVPMAFLNVLIGNGPNPDLINT